MNRACIVGNLTRDPELRTTPSGTSVCSLRVAVNSREKQGDEWIDKPNYFDVTVWGRQADSCAQFLAKGRQVAVDGRLRWSEWESSDGSKRQKVEIVADDVRFIGGKSEGGGSGSSGGSRQDVDSGPGDYVDDDIPFAPSDGWGN